MTLPNVAYEERTRMAKYVVIAVCTLFVGVQHAWFPDAASSLLTNALTMFVLGPVLLLMDFSSCTPAKRWQHYLETATRVSLLVWLMYSMSPGVLALIIMGMMLILVLVVCHCAVLGMQYTPFVSPMSKHDPSYTALSAVFLGVLDVLIVSWGGPSGVGFWLMACIIVLSITDWHQAMWSGIHTKMSPDQHTKVWAAVWERHDLRLFWDQVQLYVGKYPSDTRACLDALSLKTLLTFFRLSQSNAHLREQVKMVINEKDAHAAVAWGMYDNDDDAVEYIQTCRQRSTVPMLETMELPAL